MKNKSQKLMKRLNDHEAVTNWLIERFKHIPKNGRVIHVPLEFDLPEDISDEEREIFYRALEKTVREEEQ